MKIIATLLSATALALAAAAHEAPRKVELSVTDKGFEPARIPVKRGEPLELVVTRKTDQTCAKSIVIPDAKLKAALPLNQAVTLNLTPTRTGEMKYVCGMDMVSGVLVVE